MNESRTLAGTHLWAGDGYVIAGAGERCDGFYLVAGCLARAYAGTARTGAVSGRRAGSVSALGL